MKKQLINIRNEFSRYPAGRYLSDGPYNGERFREDFLIPALKDKTSQICIVLDGVRGYNSSFLDEAFGGLVRRGYSADELLKRLQFESRDESLIVEIKRYITDQAKAVMQS